ncbi:hypothetical protein SARC_07040 [Sphaeroforma arctica JP610]|uniref:Uncharacterized protein n=1 Tax=Sphaeroforma arctica JP610 TaxID=667725 RepID=A0A0L0FVF6_9EUKA|nr:hypothetical protein SARC_07040 [Sphaeroforma arctica JP610]KNC80604.1 hypothetical protein SARC_07040 [Sphaeroforma arctica JP610]|eukprot:XP_014154506.1 hypothetical protein SARC_07040 [Sphaeroforma arctica JP610]
MVRLLRSAHKAESASTEPLRPRVPVTSRATRTPQLKQGGSMDSGVVQDGEGKVVGERVEDSVGEGKSPATDIKLETLGADTDAYTPALLKETSIISETGSLHGASTTSASRESAVGSSSNDSISLNGTVNIGREASDLVLGFLPRNGMQHRVNATFDSEAVTQEAASTSSLPWSGNGLSDKAEGKQKRKQGDVSNDEHSSECPRKRVKHVVDALDSGHSSLTASAHSSTQYSLPVEDILLNNGLFPLEDRPGQNPLSDKNCISEVCGRNGGWMEWETEGERHARQKEDAATKAAYVFLTKKWVCDVWYRYFYFYTYVHVRVHVCACCILS